MNDVEKLVKMIVEHCARNGERESVFLTPTPAFLVDAVDLLEHIMVATDIDRGRIAVWFDDARKAKESESNGGRREQ